MSLPSINFLHLTVSEIQPGQTFYRRPPAHADTMDENNTPTALKGCGVKNDNQNYSMYQKDWTADVKLKSKLRNYETFETDMQLADYVQRFIPKFNQPLFWEF